MLHYLDHKRISQLIDVVDSVIKKVETNVQNVLHECLIEHIKFNFEISYLNYCDNFKTIGAKLSTESSCECDMFCFFKHVTRNTVLMLCAVALL